MNTNITAILTTLLLTTTLLGTSWNAPKSRYLEGSTQGHYKKPGAPVEMHFKTKHIQAGEEGAVEITLITAAKNNLLQVSIRLDPHLQSIGSFSSQQSLILEPTQTHYPLNFVVSAQEDGRFYIRLSVKIDGKGIRSFTVPVDVGTGAVHRYKSHIRKSSSGENISVSPAEETIIKK